MFAVYGVSGQLFRGSLEELRQNNPVSAVARIQAIHPLGRDDEHGSFAFKHDLVDAAQHASHASHDEAHRVGLAAYAQTQAGDPVRHTLKTVGELMSRKVITLPQTATVQEAWQTLVQRGVGQAPVVNAQGILLGLVSRADLLQLDRLPSPNTDAKAWQAFLGQSVVNIMWTPVPSVSPETDIRKLAHVLLDSGLSGLAVVDGQGFVHGFISRSDVLRAVVTEPPLDLWG